MVTKQVRIDVLHKTVTKNCVSSPERTAICSGRWWRGKPGGVYKDRIVIFFSFMGVLVRFGL
jgi:hypothetical protein